MESRRVLFEEEPLCHRHATPRRWKASSSGRVISHLVFGENSILTMRVRVQKNDTEAPGPDVQVQAVFPVGVGLLQEEQDVGTLVCNKSSGFHDWQPTSEFQTADSCFTPFQEGLKVMLRWRRRQVGRMFVDAAERAACPALTRLSFT